MAVLEELVDGGRYGMVEVVLVVVMNYVQRPLEPPASTDRTNELRKSEQQTDYMDRNIKNGISNIN